jgi:hypothetical protein
MLSDPRIGLYVSLGIAGAALLWLIGQGVASEAIWEALFPWLGYGTHAVTFLAIFLLVAAPLVALLFRRYAKVKSDLLAGRNVIARWTVDPAQFQTFGAVAEVRDRAEKRGALYLILVFVAIIFGAVALIDPEVAPHMLIAGAAIALVVTIAFWLSNRVRKRHLAMRSGAIIVGAHGLLVNDVLHVWSVPTSWLSAVELERGPTPILTITYATAGRYGTQYIGVLLPVPPEAMQLAEEVKRRLDSAIVKTSDRSRRGRRRRNPQRDEEAYPRQGAVAEAVPQTRPPAAGSERRLGTD